MRWEPINRKVGDGYTFLLHVFGSDAGVIANAELFDAELIALAYLDRENQYKNDKN